MNEKAREANFRCIVQFTHSHIIHISRWAHSLFSIRIDILYLLMAFNFDYIYLNIYYDRLCLVASILSVVTHSYILIKLRKKRHTI